MVVVSLAFQRVVCLGFLSFAHIREGSGRRGRWNERALGFCCLAYMFSVATPSARSCFRRRRRANANARDLLYRIEQSFLRTTIMYAEEFGNLTCAWPRKLSIRGEPSPHPQDQLRAKYLR